MANSPVLELQALACDPDSDILSVLMKAKMIAVKLGLSDLTEWIQLELNGYPSFDTVPEYRKGQSQLKAYSPQHQSWVPLVVNFNDAELNAMVSTFHITESISSVKKMNNKGETPFLPLPDWMADTLYEGIGQKTEIVWVISPGILEHVITTVRNKILDWSLDLESKGILGEGLQFSLREKEVAPMTVHNVTNIHGNVNNAGVIGSGNGDISQNNTVNAGDFNSLEKQLKDWGANDEDIKSLHQAIKESPAPTTPDNFSDSLGKWVVNMIGKAYAGTLNIAASAAPALLTNAICHYYNIPV
ncbi:TPA: abortive phage resistance protein [Escherichia coli]|nr:abortive phage resistance protein [Escherichia coli]